jgi:hypothetical protein
MLLRIVGVNFDNGGSCLMLEKGNGLNNVDKRLWPHNFGLA